MSNYLQNLIARSLNQVEVVRPRLASRFEPLSPNLPAAFGEVQAPETLDSEPLQGDARSTGRAQEEQKDRQLKKEWQSPIRNQPSEKIETPVWRGNQQSVPFQQQMDFQPSEPREIEKARQESDSSKRQFSNFNESGMQPRRQRTEEARPEDALSPGRALMEKEQETMSRQSLQPASKSSVPSSLQNAPEQIRRPINKQTAKQEMSESNLAELPDAREANKIGLQPRIALRLESQKASGNLTPVPHLPTAQQSDIQIAPTINVSIGRIEVRATTPAAQPRKQPSGAQTMSLDEYLQKRNRGGAK